MYLCIKVIIVDNFRSVLQTIQMRPFYKQNKCVYLAYVTLAYLALVLALSAAATAVILVNAESLCFLMANNNSLHICLKITIDRQSQALFTSYTIFGVEQFAYLALVAAAAALAVMLVDAESLCFLMASYGLLVVDIDSSD